MAEHKLHDLPTWIKITKDGQAWLFVCSACGQRWPVMPDQWRLGLADDSEQRSHSRDHMGSDGRSEPVRLPVQKKRWRSLATRQRLGLKPVGGYADW